MIHRPEALLAACQAAYRSLHADGWGAPGEVLEPAVRVAVEAYVLACGDLTRQEDAMYDLEHGIGQ